MSSTKERIEILVRRGEGQRLALAASFDGLRDELGRRRLQWRIAGWMAAGLAATATAAYRLFGKGSLAARVRPILFRGFPALRAWPSGHAAASVLLGGRPSNVGERP